MNNLTVMPLRTNLAFKQKNPKVLNKSTKELTQGIEKVTKEISAADKKFVKIATEAQQSTPLTYIINNDKESKVIRAILESKVDVKPLK